MKKLVAFIMRVPIYIAAFFALIILFTVVKLIDLYNWSTSDEPEDCYNDFRF